MPARLPAAKPSRSRTSDPSRPVKSRFLAGRFALQLGVADFDASVGGLGGCPYAPGATGNIASEELVHMVEDMGVATGVDLGALIDVAAGAERMVGHTLPSQVLRAGLRSPAIPA
jgi:hydroxymethylglutaryl-CoA lyase